MITRGTTPTLLFRLPIDAAEITKMTVTFRQLDKPPIEKTLADAVIEGKTVSVTLTEEETLSFTVGLALEIQLRLAAGEKRLASQIFTESVGRILTEGKL